MGKSIKNKIMLPVYIMTGLFILLMFLQIVIVYGNLRQVHDMEDVYFATITKSDELKLNVVQVQQWLTDISATRGAEGYDDGYAEAEAYANRVRALIDELKDIQPGNASRLEQIAESFEPYYETGKKMAAAYIAYGPEGGNHMMDEFDGVAETINTQVDDFIVYASAGIDGAIADVEESIRESVILAIVSVLMALGFCAVARIAIVRQVVRPIHVVRKAAGELSQGNLSVEIAYRSDDDLGQLAEDMRQTIQTLNIYLSDISAYMARMAQGDLTAHLTADFKGDFIPLQDSILAFSRDIHQALSVINRSANQVAGGAKQVSDGAQALADGAVEQASSIEELTATITTVSSQIRENAQIADKADHLAKEVGRSAGHSNQKMEEMTKAMEEMNHNSMEISKIIKTIEDIAFQTNILALNAAVEAARAGSAGKGFAVVADEVRNLASKSQEAANSTTALIQNSVHSVQNSSAIADMTAQSLQEVLHGIGDMVKMIDLISTASEEQSQAIEEVSQGISRIAEVVQTISSTAQESGSASEVLSDEANALKLQVEAFHLSEAR